MNTPLKAKPVLELEGCKVTGSGEEHRKTSCAATARTPMVRASGVSMLGASINNGDILLVDRAITPQHGQIVCAIVDNYFTVKYLHRKHGKLRLVAADPTIPDIIPKESQTVEVWGVVTASITRHLKL